MAIAGSAWSSEAEQEPPHRGNPLLLPLILNKLIRKLKAEPISPKLRQPFPIGRPSEERLERVIQRLQTSKLHPDSVDFISKVLEQDQVELFLGSLWP